MQLNETLNKMTSIRKFRLNPNRRIGKLIKEYRTDKDISQKDLAEAANTYLSKVGASRIPDKSAISRIESGKRELKYLEALAIADALSIKLENIWVKMNVSYIDKVIDQRLRVIRMQTGNPHVERRDYAA